MFPLSDVPFQLVTFTSEPLSCNQFISRDSPLFLATTIVFTALFLLISKTNKEQNQSDIIISIFILLC